MTDWKTRKEKNDDEQKATFFINIQYAQNASWQGQVTWTNERKSQKFRSELELIKLIDEAVEAQAGKDYDGWEKNADGDA